LTERFKIQSQAHSLHCNPLSFSDFAEFHLLYQSNRSTINQLYSIVLLKSNDLKKALGRGSGKASGGIEEKLKRLSATTVKRIQVSRATDYATKCLCQREHELLPKCIHTTKAHWPKMLKSS